MGDTEDINLLRKEYQRALARYDAACSALNRHLLNRTRANREDLQQREQDARVLLDAARSAYLEAWKREGGES
jgi:hypothetical protein